MQKRITAACSTAAAFSLAACSVFGQEGWTQLHAQSSPPARLGHAIAYDSVRSAVVLFGGQGPHALADTWERRNGLWEVRLIPGPSARTNVALSYDAARSETLLFGGGDGRTCGMKYPDTTWTWNGNEWFLQDTPGPSPRGSHALAFDSVRGVTVLFGGSGGGQPCTRHGDTWEWDGERWTDVTPDGESPSARSGHSLAFDSRRGVTVLFGGYDNDDPHLNGETWEWDGQNWTRRSADGPSARHSAAAAYDERINATIIYGGVVSLPNFDYSNETWKWDGRSWMRLNSGATPGDRYCPAMTWAGSSESSILFGGFNEQNHKLGDTWRLKLCPGDFNFDAATNSQDLFDYLKCFFASCLESDFNHDDVLNSQDFFDFLAAFFAPC